MMKPLLAALASLGVLFTAQANAQTAPVIDYTHGATLTIRALNYVDSKGTTPFTANDILSNTLLPEPPTDSKITIPVSGNYVISTSAYVCTSGSNNYVWTSLLVNGKAINSNANRANECGGAVVHAALYLNKGDVAMGLCSLNQGLPGTCQMSIALTGLPYH